MDVSAATPCSIESYDETYMRRRKYVYTWVVGNFANCKHKPGEFIAPPSFSTRINDQDLDWGLRLYPRGPTAAHELSIILTLLTQLESRQKAQVELAILGCKKTETSKHTTEFSKFRSGIHFSFHSLNPDVFHRNLFNGDLTIRCKLVFEDTLLEVETTESIELLAHECKTRVADKRLDDFERLLEAEEYSDMKLVLESREFKVHKCILSARSRVFAAMFKHNMKEKSENLVRITDVDHSVMKQLLRFIYAGKVDNLNELTLDLLLAADKYEVEDLKVYCERMLINGLNNENLVDTLVVADRCNLAELKDAVIDYFIEHREDFVSAELFKETVNSLSPGLATTLKSMMLKSDPAPRAGFFTA